MNNLKNVFSFELKTLVQKKSIKITTVILAIVILALTFLPRVLGNFTNEEGGNEEQGTIVEVFEEAGYVITDNAVKEMLEELLLLNEEQLYTDEAMLKAAVEDETIRYGFVVEDAAKFLFIVKDYSMYESTSMIFSEILREGVKKEAYEQLGVSLEEVQRIENILVEMEMVILGKDGMQGYWVSYAFVFIMYMLVLMYGMNVSTSVAREKDSRTMELLITSTNPRTLIVGKVFAMGVGGLLQISILLLALIIGFMINKSYYPEFILALISETVQPQIMIGFVMFGVVGYILYLFVYAALGSLVSKVEDVSSAVSPIMFLFIGAFMVANISLTLPDSMLAKVGSLIPFSSLLVMPIRNMMTSVSVIEQIISAGLLVITVWLTAKLSIYIYRYGSLNYGNKMKLTNILKGMIKKK